MSIKYSMTAGLGRVLRSPSLVIWVYLAAMVIALPLTAAMRDVLQESIGASLVDRNLRQGFDMDWYGEFSYRNSGFPETFGPGVVGILPVLGNLESLLDGGIFAVNRVVLAAGLLFLFAWAFLGGGILSRYALPEKPHTRSSFFSASGKYFFRFFRLLLISLLIYWSIFRWVGRPLTNFIERSTSDVTVELTIMTYTALAYLLVAFLMAFSSMVLDYAKIAMVVEERHSAILSAVRGLKFVVANPLRTGGLYLALLTVGLLLMGVYALVAPGPAQSVNSSLILAFLVGQAYLVARLILKLWFLAGQTVLFQSAQEKPTDAPAPMPATEPA